MGLSKLVSSPDVMTASTSSLLIGCGNCPSDQCSEFDLTLSSSVAHATPATLGWLPASWDILHFSLATMVGADSAGPSPSGATRWLALAQSLVTKALEIVIVGVGITLILNRL